MVVGITFYGAIFREVIAEIEMGDWPNHLQLISPIE
jgi:hypothetical protein